MSPEPDDRRPSSLLERFPAIGRIRWRASRRVPYVPQTTAVDCGAACLTMILAYHGKHLSLDEVRQAVAVDRDGASLWAIIDAAQHYGLRGRGVQVELEGLKYIGAGSILFWEFSHFVVLERVRGDSVDIVDPAVGRRRIPMKQFRRLFTGVAATFEPTAEFEPAARKGTPFWRYLKQILGHSGLMYRILATSVLIQVFALALPVLTGTLVDRVLPRGDTNLLQTLGLGLAFLVLFHLISSVLREYLFLHLRTQMDLQMTLGFVEHLVDLPYAFFQLRPAGDLMMRMNSNATVREIITTGALSTMLDGTLVSLYLVLLFAASAEMAALVLVLGFLSVSLFLVTRRKQRDLMSQSLETQARTSSYQVEMLTGMETLKAMGTERRAVDHWSNLFVDNLNILLAQGRLNAIFNSLKGALGMAGPLVILGFGGYQVLDGALSLGTMLAVNALAMGFLSPLNKLVGTAVQFQLLGSYLDRINDVMETDPEQEGVEVAQPRRLRGRIELDRVCFSYGPTSPQVVTDVSLAIRPGQHVAIVGRSGSGKSTLAKLLLGLYPPTQGRILYDDTDLSQLDCRAVRAQLGIVTQDPQLFSGSIRDNIALANPRLSLDRINEAVKLAALDEDIQQMPMGLETVLADRGLSLSGGQRQRIALARALVNRPAILLLDEATSAVDTVTEHQIHTAIEKLRCTRVTIAHRLSTVRRADVILALRDGEILEQGSFEELVARGGYFAELVAHQRDQDGGGEAETVEAAGRP